MAKSKLTKRNIKHQEEEDNWSDESVNGEAVTSKRKKASGAGKAAKRAKLTRKNIKKLEEESDWSDESVNGDASSSESSSSEESSKSSAASSSRSEEESEGSDLDYNPKRDDDAFSDDQMLSDSDNEEAESNSSDQGSSVSETEPESSADEEEIVSSSSSEGEENGSSSEEEEEILMPLTTADLDNNDKVDIKIPSLPGSDGQEVQAAIERSVAAALQIAENVHSNVVEAVQSVILEDDNADYVPDEFISYAGPKRKSVRLKNVQKKPAIVDYSSDEDEEKELLKIEKEVERNLREAEKLKKQNSKKKKKKSKPKKATKKKKPTKQESSDDEHDFEESVNESSGSEFEP